METDKEQKLQAYIDNEMSVEERVAFEGQLNADPQLKREAEELIQLNSDLMAAGHTEFKAEVNGWENSYANRQRRSKVYSLLAIAASIAVVFFIADFYFSNTTTNKEKLYASYFTPYQDMILTRGETIENESLLYKGMMAYNNGDYTISSELLEQYRINNKDDKAAALYLAISQTELGRFEPAERNYKIAMQESVFEQQAQWYLALMFIRKKDNPAAVEILNSIISNPDHYNRENAESVLKELNSQ